MGEIDPSRGVPATVGDVQWRMYSGDSTEEQVREWFEEKHGYPPEQIITYPAHKLAGPVKGGRSA